MTHTHAAGEFLVADKHRIAHRVRWLSNRIYTRFEEAPTVVGIRRRGVPLVRRIVAHLNRDHDWNPAVGEITLKRYSDDLTLLHNRPKLAEDSLTVDVEGEDVLLVDDVLYTGRTLLRATEFLLDAGAERVSGGVLCARDYPEVPVEASFVGLRLDVGPENVIKVQVPPYEDRSAIVLMHRDDVE